MGQKLPVFTTRYIIKNSIEETIMKIQERKTQLARLTFKEKISREEMQQERLDELRELFRG